MFVSRIGWYFIEFMLVFSLILTTEMPLDTAQAQSMINLPHA